MGIFVVVANAFEGYVLFTASGLMDFWESIFRLLGAKNGRQNPLVEVGEGDFLVERLTDK